MNIIKCHGSGNTFVMVGDPRYPFEMDESHLPDFAKNICSKKAFSTDGLLIVQKDAINQNHSQMRMFNPDGSEAEMCGNGLRCAARATMETFELDTVMISTLKNQHKANKEKEMAAGVYTVSVEMGVPVFDPKEIPIDAKIERIINEKLPLFDELNVSVLGMPNPHIVAVVAAGAFPWEKLKQMGSLVNDEENHLFPKGGNVNFIQKITENQFFVATYERGAGLTPSCGSGMTASSVIACILKEADFSKEIEIYNSGGFVKTRIIENTITNNYETKLIGNATYLFTGEMPYLENNNIPEFLDVQLNLAETKAYETLRTLGKAQLKTVVGD